MSAIRWLSCIGDPLGISRPAMISFRAIVDDDHNCGGGGRHSKLRDCLRRARSMSCCSV